MNGKIILLPAVVAALAVIPLFGPIRGGTHPEQKMRAKIRQLMDTHKRPSVKGRKSREGLSLPSLIFPSHP
ncbi:MAG: hypothetical protein A2X56_10670 [Nitrospirae bacterium GWC2_57_13]|jgi:hypothetical protein|nr:MAG: hypothetical protein A2X56_10670 [Nitrospirae bacterium GWC2_57_13]OGW42159.1 MAG: hypothetical protein A2X57_06320 [Nitrospirae bacterium GWD2_57_8]HAR45686.1 hypothetical protein [Nitrospiraceae bacterium]